VAMTGRLLGPKMSLSVFLKDTATRYSIAARTNVSQPFHY